jgi:hypothetical protein
MNFSVYAQSRAKQLILGTLEAFITLVNWLIPHGANCESILNENDQLLLSRNI